LIEVLIVIVIVGILAAVAYPSFMDSIRKGRRSDAFTSLSAIQLAQERWRSNHAAYAPLANTAGGGEPANGLGLPDLTSSGYYGIALSDLDVEGVGYTATATATSGTTQAGDGDCKVMAVRMQGGNLRYGSGSSAVDWTLANPDPKRCWAR
jgi:type IV pilus assembly protein PilE